MISRTYPKMCVCVKFSKVLGNVSLSPYLPLLTHNHGRQAPSEAR